MENNKQHIIEELKSLKAKKLSRHFEENQEISSDFFNSLQKNVFKEIHSNETNKISLKKFILPFALAATLLLLIAIPFFNGPSNNMDWNQLSNNDIENYFLENIEDYSLEEIASISDLNDVSLLIGSDFSDEELENYLLEFEETEEELL